jgi:4-hydroxybenzoate polyprenyltransferase
MGVKEILSFVKVEHTLFSLPFVLIGALVAGGLHIALALRGIVWILIAAVGARGLAMSLNRIIDREVDAVNPRTANRHLVSGAMSINTAWKLAAVFLAMLLIGAGMLNSVALAMAWLPVLAFVIYPYLKRHTWLCHFWLGLCLGLAPAGAWLALQADHLGWAALTGLHYGFTDFYWHPSITFISLGVLFWIAAFDIHYARLDVESDREQGIHSFPAKFGVSATRNLSILLTISWLICFYLAGLHLFPGEGARVTASPDFEGWVHLRSIMWLPAAGMMAVANLLVMVVIGRGAEESEAKMATFQKWHYRTSMATGWLLLLGLSIVEKAPYYLD